MKTLTLTKPKKVSENRIVLEKKLHVKIEVDGRRVTINGNEIDEYLTLKVIDALELGFLAETALLIAEDDFIFEKIEIKNLTKRHNLEEVRARVIGKEGRTKELVEELSECYICVSGNEVGIIGPAETIKNCMHAVSSLIQGSKQSSVYAYLEKQRKIMHPSDLGLKIEEE